MSLETLTFRMEDIKPEDPGHGLWQAHHRNPLPMPSRQPAPYDTAPSASTIYHGAPRSVYHPMHPQIQHEIPSPRNRSQGPAAARPGLTSHHSFPSSLKRSYHAIEDSQYNNDAAPEIYEGTLDADNSAKPTINPDHRLLSFGRLPDRHTILDQHGRPRTLDIAAQIHGMFFLSEIATHGGEGIVIQPELTCYRRNLFQISGSVTGPTGPLSILTEHGEAIPIVAQELAISAMESVDNHVIRLIVIPWKTPPPNSPEVPPNHEQEPLPIPIFNHADGNQDLNSDMTVQSIAWRRLQFRVATANNGRRKELQQHFVLRLTLTATLGTGAKLVIGESSTAPIVVRGRSPRNFQARKEIPLVGSAASSRGQTAQISPIERDSPTGEKTRITKQRSLDLPKRNFQFDSSQFPPSPLLIRHGYGSWSGQPQAEQSATATTPTYPTPQIPHSGYIHSGQSQPSAHGEIPIHVHTPPAVPGHAQSAQRPPYYQTTTAPPTSLALQYVDSNPRPAKSPRHVLGADVATMPLYPAFEERIAAAPYQQIQHSPHGHPGDSNVPTREYFPLSVPSETWTSGEGSSVLYSTSMPPPSVLQQHHPQHHPQQAVPQHHSQHQHPQQHYAFPSETYQKEEGHAQSNGHGQAQNHQSHYTWGSA